MRNVRLLTVLVLVTLASPSFAQVLGLPYDLVEVHAETVGSTEEGVGSRTTKRAGASSAGPMPYDL